ncbi:Flp family type IVb pilin [Tsuneonella mangrovi]|uniref:Flp family type IVb pilin n=1 Tax=Tsuneonella mangrovi TaxID=1982042 RepID=UPI000BA2338A|nr:Flp family type IVb pilin [Tsuneonella mangrovi]
MSNILFRFVRDEAGATAIEYGLILSMVFLAMVGAVQVFGNETIGMWNRITTDVKTAINK